MRERVTKLLLVGALVGGLTACGTDDGSGVRVIDEGDGSASGSTSGSASGSASGPAGGSASGSASGVSETEVSPTES